MDDKKLLRLLRTDPNTGMEKLIEKYAGLVYAVVTRALPDPCDFTSELEDCVSDVFSEFYLDLDRYDPRLSSIKTYLCVIARNNAVDLLRRRKIHLSLDDADIIFPGAEGSPEADVMKKQLRSDVLKAVQEMGEPDRTILLRKFYYLQPSKDIARDLGMTVSNVDTRTHRAIAKLRKMFGGDQRV